MRMWEEANSAAHGNFGSDQVNALIAAAAFVQDDVLPSPSSRRSYEYKHEMNSAYLRTWRALRANRSALAQQPISFIVTWAPVIGLSEAQCSSKSCQSSPLPSSSTLHITTHPQRSSFRQSLSVNTDTLGCRTKFSSNTQNDDFATTVSKWLTKRREFSNDEIKLIFGPKTPVLEGNRLLYEVQDQRLAGTIDQIVPGSQRNEHKALIWLRENVPFDEDRAILQRLEREENAALRPQGQQRRGKIYAESMLERIRKENLRKQSKEEQLSKASKPEHKSSPLSREQALVRRREESLAWKQKWHDNTRKDDLHSVPQMSFIQRVGPGTLLTFTVISFCVMFAQNYSPPSEAARLFTSITPAAATIGVIIGLNVIVWLGWRITPLRRSMQRTFLLAPVYPWSSSIVGSVFSHQSLHHLVANMIALWFIGRNRKHTQNCLAMLQQLTSEAVHEDIGRGPFLVVFLSCGVGASNVFLISTVLRKRWDHITSGCSGAISGILATWLWINSEYVMILALNLY